MPRIILRHVFEVPLHYILIKMITTSGILLIIHSLEYLSLKQYLA